MLVEEIVPVQSGWDLDLENKNGVLLLHPCSITDYKGKARQKEEEGGRKAKR